MKQAILWVATYNQVVQWNDGIFCSVVPLVPISSTSYNCDESMDQIE